MRLHDPSPHRVTESLPDGIRHIAGKLTNTADLVREFHERFGIAIGVPLTDERTAALRLSLIDEEADDLAEAIAGGNVLEVARELADLTYVVYGSAITWGLELDNVWPPVADLNVEREVERLAGAVADGNLALAAVALENLRDAVTVIAQAWRIDLNAAVRAVHEANMRKVAANGEPTKHAGGKVAKPPGWVPPDLSAAVVGAS